MKKRLSVALAAVVAVAALVAANSASAATVFGSGCTANQITDGAIWISTGHAPANTLPVTAPISGVITEWTVNTDIAVESEGKLVGEFPRVLQQRLLVTRAEGELFKVVGEASGGLLNLKGSNTYNARVPVQAGDYLGIAGSPFAAWCDTKDPADTYAAATGGTPVGSIFRVERATGLQVPITARVEPDADGDGYGDETQDGCPQSAAYQTPCPVVTVSSLSLTHPKAVTVYVASSLSAPIAVTGTVKLGKGKTTTLNAPGQTVAPGMLGRFNLALTKPVLKTLKDLSMKKALTLTVSASATNVTGSPSTAASTVKLRGQKKAAHAKKAHHPKAVGARQTLKPSVRSAHASGIDDWSAVMRGNINPHGLETSWRFQLGTTRAYGLPHFPASLEKPLGGSRRIAVEEAVNCLAPMTTYHFRIVAKNKAGKTYGPDQAFTTKRRQGPEAEIYERCPGAKPLG